uniref:hypothetical protein n=1 Tax=Rhodella violacea TaxID=2801 RepID=UPI001FCD1D87|nr:hypothetical protein MW504_pgp090 [Rhodella violacea]UNJ18086.1 hypothetical protein [Rhodella violacea]
MINLNNFTNKPLTIIHQIDIKKKLLFIFIVLGISCFSTLQINILILIISIFISKLTLIRNNLILHHIKSIFFISILTIINFYCTVNYIDLYSNQYNLSSLNYSTPISKMNWSLNIGMIIFSYLLLIKIILMTTLPENLIFLMFNPINITSTKKYINLKIKFMIILTLQVLSIIFRQTYYIIKVMQIRSHAKQDQNLNYFITLSILILNNLIYRIFTITTLISSILYSKNLILINDKCLSLWEE